MAVYLDHNATTPLDSRVLDAMMPYLLSSTGNPSSTHSFGRRVREAVEISREQVASLINAHPSQVIFTGSGTEANNLAVKGFAELSEVGCSVFSAVEHVSVIASHQALHKQGWHSNEIAVDAQGRVSKAALQEILSTDTKLVSVMWANNETGVIQDVTGLSELVRSAGAVMHCDAVQALGKLDINFDGSGVQLMSLSSHKIYGPQGVGALVRDKSLELEAVLHGGGQEGDLRSGSENIAGIIGFGKAAELAVKEQHQRSKRCLQLRQRLESQLREIVGISIFSELADRLANTTFFAVAGIEGETLLMALDTQGFAVSSGSACSVADSEASHVLRAMGVDDELSRCAIRVSIGKDNSCEDIDAFVQCLKQQISSLQAMTSRAWAV